MLFLCESGLFSLYKMLTVHPRFASQSLQQNQLSRREKSHKVKNLPIKTSCLWGWQAHSSWKKESQAHGAGGVPRQSCSRWGSGCAAAPCSPCSLAPCSSRGVGEEEQGWKRAMGSVTDSSSWQMLAGFQYSKEEPDCHRFQPRAWVPGGQCLTCPKPGTSKCWIRTWATLNSLNSFQHTQLLSGPQWAPLPRPSLKPEQQKEDMGQEDHSSYLSRPQTRGTRRQFHVEEKPLQFDTTWQEPEHPKKVRSLVLPYNSHSAFRRKDQLF